jgi:iron complex outermembrane receptor protein
MLGAYVRDNMRFGEKWNLSAGLRFDTTASYTLNQLNDERTNSPAQAASGAVGVMYELFENVRPYMSYSTSFYPNTGTDVNGKLFKPEEGRQLEAGIKFDLQPGKTLLTLAVFDMRRENVLQGDPVNDDYSIAIGEQRTRGGEIGLTSDITDRLSLMGGYAYTTAVITDDGGNQPSTEGTPLDNVSRHSATLHARYRFSGTRLGWAVSGGVRGESEKYTNGYYIPGYAVANLGLAYEAEQWHAALNLRNVFDKHYYTGGTPRAVAMGDDRTMLMTVGYRY